MPAAFNLTAQINLQGPANLKPIVSKIKKEFGSIKTKLDLEVKPGTAKNIGQITRSLNTLSKAAINANTNIANLNTTLSSLASSFNNASSSTSAAVNSLNTTSKAVQNTTKAVNNSRTAIEEFGKQSGLAIKRFAAFSTVTSVVFGFVNALNSAFKEFVVFNQEIVRLSQVTNKSVADLKGISDEITRLSTGLGVASGDLLKVTTTLAQAGFTAEETKTALEALAKSALAPSFDDIASTTEGAIAAMRQFGIQANELDSALGSINAVAAAFAVEASDIITAIQRTGGVFAASSKGVSEGTDALNEFIAVFTSIRATTRESAETIATGLRTIFTRIQRSSTIQLLKDYGVELRNLEGKFVGPYEAVRRLSDGLNKLDPRSAAFAAVSEELGGFRQIGKVIPLIQQFATAQDALKIAQKGQGSLAKDAIDAQQALAVQFIRTRESFLALIRDIGDTGTFKAFANTTLILANSLINLGGALKPILPLLLAFSAIKIGGGIREYVSGFTGAFGRGGGGAAGGPAPTGGGGGGPGGTGGSAGKTAALVTNTTAITTLNQSILALNQNIVNTNSLLLNRPTKGFASGGVVPGSGNRDTVPAMLTPGEFVIRKKAVEAIGAGNLQKINKYQWGGKVAKLEKLYPSISNAFGYDDVLNDQINDTSSFVEVKPEQLSKEDRNKWKRSKNKSWKKFEDLLERSFGVGKSASGIGSKWSLLDFPYTRSESKFMPKGSTYNDPDTIKGNNEATIAAKNYLFEQSTFKNKGNKPNLKVEELEKIQSLSPATVYWGDPKKFNSAGLYNLGGIVQKFVGGGQAQALGARPTVRQLDKTELAQLSTTQLIKYANDLAYDLLSTGAAGMAIGSEFIEVPKEKIIPELESSLVSYMGKRGFWREKVARFGKPIEQKSISASKLGREAALESQVSRHADEVAARSQEWTSIRSGSSIDNYLMKSLQDPILSDYKSAREGKPLAKAFHQTRLRKAVNEALDSFDDFDYSGGNIDKLVSAMAAKRFARGGKASSDFTGYHGSPHIFSKIDASKLGMGSANLYGAGLNMAMDRGMAELYAKRSGAVYPVTVKGGISDFIEAKSLLSENPKALQSIQKIFKQQKIPVKGLEQSTFRDALNKLTERLLEQIEKNLPNKPGVDAKSRFMEAFGIASQKVRELMVTAGIPGVKVTTNMPLDEQMAVAYDLERVQLGKPLKSKRFAYGGSVEDTVPALLTPGEFVINKKAAQKIGYGKLNKLNHADKIQGFNKGGLVGVQTFARGGQVNSDKTLIAAVLSSALLPQLEQLSASFMKLEGESANLAAGFAGAVKEASSFALSTSIALNAVGATGRTKGLAVGIGVAGGAISGAVTEYTGKAIEKALLKNTESLGKFSKDLKDYQEAPTEELRQEASKRLEKSFTTLDNAVRNSVDNINRLENAKLIGEKLGSFNSSVLTIITSMVALKAATYRLTSVMNTAGSFSNFASKAGIGAAIVAKLGGLATGIGIGLTVISAAIELFSYFNTSLKQSTEQLNKVSEALEETAKNSRDFNLDNQRYTSTVLPEFDKLMSKFKKQQLPESEIRRQLGSFNIGNEFNILLRTQLKSILAGFSLGIRENQTIEQARSTLTPNQQKSFDLAVQKTQEALTADLFIRAKKQEGISDPEAIQKLLKELGGASNPLVKAIAEEYAGQVAKIKLASDQLTLANNNLKISLVSLNNVLGLVESSFQKVASRTTNQFNDLDRSINTLTGGKQQPFIGGEFIRRDKELLDNLTQATGDELEAFFGRAEKLLGIGKIVQRPGENLTPEQQQDQIKEQRKVFEQFKTQTRALSVLERTLGPQLTFLSKSSDKTNIRDSLEQILGPSLRGTLGIENEATTIKLLNEIDAVIARAREEGKTIDTIAELGAKSETVSKLLDTQKQSVELFGKSLDSVSKIADLLVDQHKKLIEQEEELRQVQIQRRQTELQTNIELKRSLGEYVSLRELNNVFYQEIKDLTAGLNTNTLPKRGTLDIKTLENALKTSTENQRKLLAEARNATPERQGQIDIELAREVNVINNVTKALKGLADSSIATKNTLEEIAKQRDLFKSQREVLFDLITGAGDPTAMLKFQSAAESLSMMLSRGGNVNLAEVMQIKDAMPILEKMFPAEEFNRIFNNFLQQFLQQQGQFSLAQFVGNGGTQMPGLLDALQQQRVTRNAAEDVLNQTIVQGINERAVGITNIFKTAYDSLIATLPGIVKFFQDLQNTKPQTFAPTRKPPEIEAALIEKFVQELEFLGPGIRTINEPMSGLQAQEFLLGALSEAQVSGFKAQIQPGMSYTELEKIIKDIAATLSVNRKTMEEKTAGGVFGRIFNPKAWTLDQFTAVEAIDAQLNRFLENVATGQGDVAKTLQQKLREERLYQKELQDVERKNQESRRRGIVEPTNQNFPIQSQPLPLDTSKLDTTVDRMVAIFTSPDNNIIKLASSVESLKTVTDSFRVAIEELKRTIPDGRIKMEINQKSQVDVSIPEGVDINSSSMKLDSGDSDRLANSIANSIKSGIGGLFTFSGVG